MDNPLRFLRYFLSVYLLLAVSAAWAQTTFTVTGRVMDAQTGEPVPFANVYFVGTQKGVTSNLEGYYELKYAKPMAQLAVSFIGYKMQTVNLDKAKAKQHLIVRLEPDATMLSEVVITQKGYENPAWEILRNVMDNKKRHDLRQLAAYQYEAYTKVELDVDNLSERFLQKKVVQDMLSVIDSGKQINGEDGRACLPLFVSEAISDMYWENNPRRRRENIHKSRISGVGIKDQTLFTQISGGTFQEYNFYDNWLNILTKDFVSPIADGWKLQYDYTLYEPKEVVDGVSCYRISFVPKRKEDLAFTGTMWIADSLHHYALKQIDVTVDKRANINFIEKIKIQQVNDIVEDGSLQRWMPSQTRITVDVSELTPNSAGMLAKFYTSNAKYRLNQPVGQAGFFDVPMVVDQDAYLDNEERHWKERRHHPLSEVEQYVFQVIDTVKTLPRVRTYTEVIDFLVNGHREIRGLKGVEFGPVLSAFAYNNVEGARFQIGGRTTNVFSKKFSLSGYGAYGTKDGRFKGSLRGEFIFSRKPWSTVGAMYYNDVERLGAVISEDAFDSRGLFNLSLRWGRFRNPYRNERQRIWISTDVFPDLGVTAAIEHNRINPLYEFEYLLPTEEVRYGHQIRTTEAGLMLRYAPGVKFIETYTNQRAVFSQDDKPILTATYAYAIPDFLGSNFSYHRVRAVLRQNFRLGMFGRTQYRLEGGWISGTLPYPLLQVHLGNNTMVYNSQSLNLMQFGEFASDHYASLQLTHYFEGLIMNRIPVIRKWNWRSFITGNIVTGGLSENNKRYQESIIQDPSLPRPKSLSGTPYAEVGYGIENILRFIRIDFLHRLSYREKAERNFGVFVSAQFKL